MQEKITVAVDDFVEFLGNVKRNSVSGASRHDIHVENELTTSWFFLFLVVS